MALVEQHPYCEICPVIEQPSELDRAFRIYEGEAWRATLRVNQAQLGTTYVTLKQHKENLRDLSASEREELWLIYGGLSRAAESAFSADLDNFSCLMNYAFRSNDDPNFVPQPHVHWHFKPRYSGVRKVGGERFTDPEFGGPLKLPRVQNVGLPLGGLIVARMQENFRLAA